MLIHFYNVGVYKDNIKTNKEFLEILENISNNASWEQKVRKLPTTGKLVAIFPIRRPIPEDDRYTIVPFGLFRSKYQPKVGSLESPDLVELRDLQANADIVELATFVYDKHYNLIIFEYNRSGPKKAEFEEYFTSFFNENSNQEVRLSVMESDNNIETVLNSSQIRNLEILFTEDYNGDENFVYDEVDEDERNILNTLRESNRALQEFNPESSGIILKANVNKDSTMELNRVKTLIRLIANNKEKFETVKVRYRNSRNGELDTVDLTDLTLDLKTRIFQSSKIDNPSPELIGAEIIIAQENFLGRIMENYSEFIRDIEDILIEDIIYEIPEKYRIPEEDDDEEVQHEIA